MKTQFNLRQLGVLTLLATSLGLAGCSDSDSKGFVSAPGFHKAEWATIKDLDPRGEQCVDCHGKNPAIGVNTKGHNIGLANNTDHSAYQDVKITSVKVHDDPTDTANFGKVTVKLNQALPAGNVTMTFAKLAPRVIHNRGHDWQNYFVNNNLGRGGNEPASDWFPNGGAAPFAITPTRVSATEYTFNLGDGAGREFGKHNFTQGTAYAADKDEAGYKWEYEGVLGTKFSTSGWNIADHVTCDAAAEEINLTGGPNAVINANIGKVPANQKAATKGTNSGKRPVCWWPDGTHLTSGVFVSDKNEYIVEYDADLTHRVTFIVGMGAGNPGFNTWYDFVPSIANKTKTIAELEAKYTKEVTTVATSGTANSETAKISIDLSKYVDADGSINADNYLVAVGAAAPDSENGAAITAALHQALPAAREVVDMQSCNSCHDGFAMHGGSGRAQTQVCVTCHNPGNLQASSGRSVDFKQLVHRIHRGANLPSEDATIADLMDGKSLVADTATDFTKVRFPQGPTPGSAAGITNCVKCHMGEETKNMVQGLAEALGAGDEDAYDVQSKMKLAKVTPQGDNWLSVRSVNACQACHDSNVWFADADPGTLAANRTDPENPSEPAEAANLSKYYPLYTKGYTDVGFKWLGKKEQNENAPGWVHGIGTADDNGRFTCGSGGGCHGNPDITTGIIGETDTTKTDYIANVGDGIVAGQNRRIHRAHLKLTRDFIIAERFEIKISNPAITEEGAFTADVQVLDKQNNNTALNIAQDGNNGKITDTPANLTADMAVTFGAQLGWMRNSPDYNHSPGGGIPGSPLSVSITWDGSDKGQLSADLASMVRADDEWKKHLEGNFENIVGTVFVQGGLDGKYNLQTAVTDFRFDGEDLADEGRRKVVDFTAGNGIDESRGRYDGWDKHDGANTQSCSSCHLQLAYHGPATSVNKRTNNVQACIVCHNPQRTDINTGARQGQLSDLDGQYEESLDFKRLIHAIHSAPNKRIDPMYVGTANSRPSQGDDQVRGHSFPGVIDNCKACHIETEPGSGKWTFELDQLPEGMIGSTAITADWKALTAKEGYSYAADGGVRHDFDGHMKMSPIASVCSSCHDAGYKGGDDKARMNNNILDGGPYVGSHWWVMGGIAPGIVPDNGTKPSATKHQSGK